MTDVKKAAEKEQVSSFDMASCLAMMEQMIAGQDQGCDCADTISLCTDQEEIPGEWAR